MRKCGHSCVTSWQSGGGWLSKGQHQRGRKWFICPHRHLEMGGKARSLVRWGTDDRNRAMYHRQKWSLSSAASLAPRHPSHLKQHWQGPPHRLGIVPFPPNAEVPDFAVLIEEVDAREEVAGGRGGRRCFKFNDWRSISVIVIYLYKRPYSYPPLNDTVKSLNSIFNYEQYAFPIKTT